MKCSDILDLPILQFLAGVEVVNGERLWATHMNGYGAMPSVRQCFPPGTPEKLVLAKMRQMMRRGVITGCPCGCRGDWVITEKGLREAQQ